MRRKNWKRRPGSSEALHQLEEATGLRITRGVHLVVDDAGIRVVPPAPTNSITVTVLSSTQ